MDEVDGMSAGDRGGVADLIQTLKGAKLPIICICNDKYNQKLKSLRNHCLELDFRSAPLQCPIVTSVYLGSCSHMNAARRLNSDVRDDALPFFNSAVLLECIMCQASAHDQRLHADMCSVLC